MNASRTKTKTAPTHYPRLVFHGLRTAQLLSSAIVGSIMGYFMWHLTHEHWNLPWTFILLMTVSFLTVLVLATTIVLHCCCGLNPRLNLLFNSGLCVLWALGWSLLSWWASKTLTHVCNKNNWNDENGIMVCRMYKALYAFATLGFFSTLCALLLDVWVFKRATRLGKYNAMQDLDNKRKAPQYGAPEGEFGQQPTKPFTDAPSTKAERSGYEVPEEQFNYDTTYHGAHPQNTHA